MRRLLLTLACTCLLLPAGERADPLFGGATGDVHGISSGEERAPSGFGQPSEFPHLSADGSTVAFSSQAGDLAPGDGNGAADVIVYEWCPTAPEGPASGPVASTVAPPTGPLFWESTDAACNALAPAGL